jgi:hypothetical protein
MEKEYNFKVNTIEAGQRGKYQDSYYTYEVTSALPPDQVKDFCMKLLKPCAIPSDMESPFHTRFLGFDCISHDISGYKWSTPCEDRTYNFRASAAYTG